MEQKEVKRESSPESEPVEELVEPAAGVIEPEALKEKVEFVEAEVALETERLPAEIIGETPQDVSDRKQSKKLKEMLIR